MASKVVELFEKHNDEYCKFDRINKPLSRRPDIHAFLLLDKLFPGTDKIIDGAGLYEIYLNVELSDIEQITEEDIIDLMRCGVGYNSSTDTLCMFI